MTICVDASFIARLLVGTPEQSQWETLWIQWHESASLIVAPTLLYYEISNALHRLTVANQLTIAQADQALSDALSLEIQLYGNNELHQQAIALARQLNLPAAYDAHYLALAQRLEAEFWTSDRRLFNAVQSTLTWVHLVT